MSEQYLTQAEVAEHLRVSIHAVRKWRASGLLPFVRIGKTVLITRADVEELLATHRHPKLTA